MHAQLASQRLVHLGGVWYARSHNPFDPRPFAVLRMTENRFSSTRVSAMASSPVLRALPSGLGLGAGTASRSASLG